MLVGQVNEIEVDFAVGRHQAKDSVLEGFIGDVDYLLGNALDVTNKSWLFLYVWLIFLALYGATLLVILFPCLFYQIDIQNGVLDLINAHSLEIDELKADIGPCYFFLEVVQIDKTSREFT